MNLSALFLALAFVWVLQLIFSLLQTKRFHKSVAELRKQGAATSVGISGRNWTLKNYGVLVVDEERVVIRAQKLTGFTVFANLKDVPQLSGFSLERFDSQEPVTGVKKKLWQAFQSAAAFIIRHDKKQLEEKEQVKVED